MPRPRRRPRAAGEGSEAAASDISSKDATTVSCSGVVPREMTAASAGGTQSDWPGTPSFHAALVDLVAIWRNGNTPPLSRAVRRS